MPSGLSPPPLFERRWAPEIGSIAAAAISFQTRRRPLPRGSRTSQAVRWNISPSATPPNVVLIRSLTEGRLVSPKYSHVPLPTAATSADDQNPRPFDRPAVK